MTAKLPQIKKDKGHLAKIKQRLHGWILFIKEILANPAKIGAACPSSPRLAAMIADQIPHSSCAGTVIELGGGTGVITTAILKRITAQQLIVVERATQLANHLKRLFPEITIISGDAAELIQLLPPHRQPTTIVSGLPLRSLPEEVVQTILHQVEQVLNTGELFIQFTYSYNKPKPYLTEQLKLTSSRWVWFNLPPARVDVYQRQ